MPLMSKNFKKDEKNSDATTININWRTIRAIRFGCNVPLNPRSSKGHSYIFIPTDYFTKWQETISLRKNDSKQLIIFLNENILSRFNVLEKFITINDSFFIGYKFTIFCGEYGIIMGQSSNYYPQGNSLV